MPPRKKQLAARPEPPPVTTPVVTEDDHAYELYLEHQKQAWQDLQSGSDEFDKSILTYSSAGLGLSVAFIKDIVPLASADGLPLLYASWVAFGLAILTTVFSFQLSVNAQTTHLDHLRKYYLEKKPEYINAPNPAGSWVGYLKWISGLCFVLAVGGTIYFSIWNVRETRHMTDDRSRANDGRTPATMRFLREGRGVLQMTPLDLTKGRVPMSMTPVPQQAQSATAPPPAAPPQNKK